MSQAKGSAAAKRKKAAAARAEKNGKPKSFDYRGLEIEIPPQPLAEIGYLFSEIRDREDAGLPELRELAEAIIGSEQMAKVRAKHLADKLTLDALPGELQTIVSSAFNEYGMSVGESSASSRS